MACNPTVQYNDFTGNGSTTQFTFTFPYDNTTDVHVRLGTYPNYTYPAYGTGTTEYQVDPANPTTVVFGTAPTGAIRIFRCTPNNVLPATFQAGSAIRSSDLNNNFNQILFVSQDASIRSVDAQGVADTAYTQSNTAISTANTALSTAQTAEANSIQAVNTANTADTNATAAVNTANNADANATTALNNSRESDGQGGFTSAIDIANTALTNSRESDGQGGFNSAIDIANDASSVANAAQSAVANAVIYAPIANVASIPGSPSDGDYIEVIDSTGVESFTPLTGLPSGFIGATGLTVRLRYLNSNSSWNWQMYFASDPEVRYYPATSGATNASNIATNVTNIATNASGIATNASDIATNTSNISINTTAIATKMPLAGGTFTGLVTLSGAPTASLHAATKQYVDDNKLINVDGGNFTAGTSLVTSTSIIDGGSF